MANIFGQLTDIVGTSLGLPEFGLSEKVGGGNTVNTQNYQYAQGNNPYSWRSPSYVPASTSSNQGQFRQWNTVTPQGTLNPINQGGSSSNQSLGGQVSSGGYTWSNQKDYEIDKQKAQQMGLSGPEEYKRLVSERENQLRGTIESGFSNIQSQLDQMAGLLPSQQAEDEATLQNKYQSQLGGIQSARENTNKSLDLSKQRVQESAKKSTADVATNLRNMLKASAMQLGAIGAGNSSATQVMAPYAYSKLASGEQANVQRQANDQYLQIDQKKTDVQTTYDSQVANLGTWLADSQAQIKNNYRQQLAQIQNAKIGADQQKLQALSTLETSLLNQAQNQLAQIESEARANATAIQNWALQRLAALDDYKVKLSSAGSFNPQDIVTNELAAMNMGGFGNGGSNYQQNTASAKKKYNSVTGQWE